MPEVWFMSERGWMFQSLLVMARSVCSVAVSQRFHIYRSEISSLHCFAPSAGNIQAIFSTRIISEELLLLRRSISGSLTTANGERERYWLRSVRAGRNLPRKLLPASAHLLGRQQLVSVFGRIGNSSEEGVVFLGYSIAKRTIHLNLITRCNKKPRRGRRWEMWN